MITDETEALNCLKEISRLIIDEMIDDIQAIKMVINKISEDIIFCFYMGNCMKFEELCEIDDKAWDLIEEAADELEL